MPTQEEEKEKKTEQGVNENQPQKSKNSIFKNKNKEQLFTDIYVGFLVVSLFIIIIGGIWAIKDIFTQTGFQDFKGLTVASQILIIAVILLGLVFLILFLMVLYKRGRKILYEVLYEEKEPKEKDVEEYLPAKIIAASSLVCIFIVFIGLIIAMFQYLIEGVDSSDVSGVWAVLGSLSGGTKVLLFGFTVLIMVLLVLGFSFLWQNGYYYFMNQILKLNEKYDEKYNYKGNQKIISQVVFGLFVANVVLIGISIVWSIISATAFSWSEDYSSMPFGFQFSFMGLLGTGLFLVLIAAMSLYKWGLNLISSALFGKKEESKIDHDNSTAKILTIFMLASIFLIAISIIIWLSSLIAGAIGGVEETNLISAFSGLSTALQVLSYSILIFIFLVLMLSFVYLLKNGYYVAFRLVTKTEEAMEEGIEKTEKKFKKKSKEKTKDKKD